MDDGQFPTSGGWFWAWVAAAIFIARALEYPIAWLAGYLGWRRSKDAERAAELISKVHAKVSDRIDSEMSEMRQHIAAMQRGLEGKQAHMETTYAELYREMRDRDDLLTEALHQRLTQELSAHEQRMVQQLDRLRAHLSDLVHVALHGRPTRR